MITGLTACNKNEFVARIKLFTSGITYDEKNFLNQIEKGNEEKVTLFLSAGMTPNLKDSQGRTPLMFAVIKEHLGIVQKLIEKGADVNIKDSNGGTAIMDAAALGKNEIIELLINKGADINAKTADGKTPLMATANKGNIDAVNYLLGKNADINSKDIHGSTVLMQEMLAGHKDVVQILLKNGADVKAKDDQGLTVLEIAIDKDYMEIAALVNKARFVITKNLGLDRKTGYVMLTLARVPQHGTTLRSLSKI